MASTKHGDLVIYDPADYPDDGLAHLLIKRYRESPSVTAQADAEMALEELGLWLYISWWPGCVRGEFVPPKDDPHFGVVVDKFECVVRSFTEEFDDCDGVCEVVVHTSR